MYPNKIKKKGVIISALGEKSFSKEQINKIKSVLDVNFIKQVSPVNKKEFIELAKDAQILAVTRRPIKDIDSEIIDSLPQLESIAVYTTGCEWIDVEYLSKKGITLSYLPDYATITVAEHTLATMLVMSRRVHLSFDKIRKIIPDGTSLRGWDLRGKNLGIVGFGRIGQEVGRLSKAFGMNICYYDPIKIKSEIAVYSSYDELLKNSDVIVIICSKERNAPPIMSTKELQLVKPGAYIINTARADLVDNHAIVEALQNKSISGYVVDDEVATLSNADSIDYGRIFQTGHTAWYSTEAIERGTDDWVNNIVALANGEARNVFERGVLVNE
ncbi:MAG: hypothetical protein KAX49_01960 [Halanaerobiales bacterium]|nr:hypothetical protein [Halanaerobiales bacterium]